MSEGGGGGGGGGWGGGGGELKHSYSFPGCWSPKIEAYRTKCTTGKTKDGL